MTRATRWRSGLICCVLLHASAAWADEPPPAPEGWRVLAETFPANFFLRGVNLQLKAKPPGLGRFMLGFGGATIGYDKDAMELINPTNKGWESRSYRIAVTVDYFFPEQRRGLFVGSIIGLELQTVWLPEDKADDRTVSALFAAPVVGYQWFPFGRHGFEVTPTAGVIVARWFQDNPQIATSEFKLPSILPVFLINVGWELSL